MQLAGEIPTGDSPDFPEERPPTSQERTAVLKDIARQIAQTGEAVATIARISSWLSVYWPSIESYNDTPKSLDEPQSAVSTPASGYDIHHIVEQTQAEADGYPREQIDSGDNWSGYRGSSIRRSMLGTKGKTRVLAGKRRANISSEEIGTLNARLA